MEGFGSAEAFLRGPFLDMAQAIPRSRIRHLLRLMVSEGPKHPDLTKYYWENIAGPGLAALRRLFAKGVANGEFRASALDRFPQLLIAPILFSTLWQVVFEPHEHLDTDALLAAHVNFVIEAIRRPAEAPS